MTAINTQRCPCDANCKQKRAPVVNQIMDKGSCTATELRNLLSNKLGEHAFRSSLEFLSSGKCKLVDVYGIVNGQKPPQFGRQGRLFCSRTISTESQQAVVIGLLSHLQKRLLDKFELSNKRIYYFTTYDLRRLTPAAGNEVEYAIKRLIKLGLLSKVTIAQTDFYVKPHNIPLLLAAEKQAIIDDKTEYAVVKIVHELIMNLYPANIITGYEDRIRPHTQDILTITGGMAFDIFYQFFDPLAGRNYLAIDVYTRIPVTGYMINSFAKKIDWAKTIRRKSTTNYLKDKTFGIIVFRNATRNAFQVAKKLGIRFLRLSDIKVDYKQLRSKKEIEEDWQTTSII